MLSYDHIFNVKVPCDTSRIQLPITVVKPLPVNVQKTVANMAWRTKGKALVHQDYMENFDFCDDEIKKVMARKTWTAMDKCFKWLFIDSYLKDHDICIKDIANVKVMFSENKLKNIEFSNKERRILSLNITVANVSL